MYAKCKRDIKWGVNFDISFQNKFVIPLGTFGKSIGTRAPPVS